MSIEVLNESGEGDINEEMLVDVSSFALAAMDVHPETEVTITLVDEPTMADLHVRWMDLEGPTDVMSFPMDELTPAAAARMRRSPARRCLVTSFCARPLIVGKRSSRATTSGTSWRC